MESVEVIWGHLKEIWFDKVFKAELIDQNGQKAVLGQFRDKNGVRQVNKAISRLLQYEKTQNFYPVI